ncbi:hypothetical protein [Candidatus Methylacidithermus pantelleriae]|nr:hypothetical protein [Candidatus Methylacidithermus pantelleriae]
MRERLLSIYEENGLLGPVRSTGLQAFGKRVPWYTGLLLGKLPLSQKHCSWEATGLIS